MYHAIWQEYVMGNIKEVQAIGAWAFMHVNDHCIEIRVHVPLGERVVWREHCVASCSPVDLILFLR